MKRREFMIGSAAASVAIASVRKTKAGAPAVLIPAAVKPLVISSANGNRFKNGGWAAKRVRCTATKRAQPLRIGICFSRFWRALSSLALSMTHFLLSNLGGWLPVHSIQAK